MYYVKETSDYTLTVNNLLSSNKRCSLWSLNGFINNCGCKYWCCSLSKNHVLLQWSWTNMIFKWFIIIILKTFRVPKLQVKLHIRRFIFMVQYYAVRLHQCCGNFASQKSTYKVIEFDISKGNNFMQVIMTWENFLIAYLWNTYRFKLCIMKLYCYWEINFSHSKSFVLTFDLVETCISLYTLPVMVKAYDFPFAFSTKHNVRCNRKFLSFTLSTFCVYSWTYKISLSLLVSLDLPLSIVSRQCFILTLNTQGKVREKAKALSDFLWEVLHISVLLQHK